MRICHCTKEAHLVHFSNVIIKLDSSGKKKKKDEEGVGGGEGEEEEINR